MKVAIVHYWLIGMRGGEKVVEALCKIFPEADIFTHVYAPDMVSPIIRSRPVFTSFIDRLPRSRTMYKSYLPLMPLALEQLDLRGYDLIISSESGPAKGIIPPADALHICYCHSPMRYIWNMFHDYRENAGFIKKIIMPPLSHYIRNWDAITASRVHHFVANSQTVSRRLNTYYRRASQVIYPPVEVEEFAPVHPSEVEDYYLMVGELVRYKRPDLAVEAFKRSGRKLIVIGGGEMLKTIKADAAPNVTVLGPQNAEQLRYYYSRCRALVFPGEEDFGVIPVEAMASGRPVIAYAKGGATETVVDGKTGLFFSVQTPEAINEACDKMETMTFDQSVIVAHARQFNAARFREEMGRFVSEKLHLNKMATPSVAA